ncbi:MAG: LicD family protein [Acutalibacteraceae bacterium]|nr:LicD family protein [Acutalibacteraceae bacterium]
MVDLNLNIPNDFYNEEVRCGYKIDKKMKKVWAVELDLLDKLLSVCKKHNIQIFAGGGTVLGAVRHKGFIPWDDDIDMLIFRDQYDKLCEVAKYEFEEPYFFQTEFSDPGSLRRHAQLRNSNTTAILSTEKNNAKFNQGVFIDIFPMDSIVEDEEKFYIQEKQAKNLMKTIYRFSDLTTRYDKDCSSGIKRIIKNVLHPVLDVCNSVFNIEQRLYKKYEYICSKYNNEITTFVSTISVTYSDKRYYGYREDYKKEVFVPFEFLNIPIPNGFDRTLRMQYGKYEDYIVGSNNHGSVLFDTEKSYKFYLKERENKK